MVMLCRCDVVSLWLINVSTKEFVGPLFVNVPYVETKKIWVTRPELFPFKILFSLFVCKSIYTLLQSSALSVWKR